MRNMATHHQFKWEDGTDIFAHLMIIVYFSILNRAGIAQDKARECIRDGFLRVFKIILSSTSCNKVYTMYNV